MWDARGHALRLKTAAKAKGYTVSVLFGLELLFEDDGAAFLRAKFGGRGTILKSTIRAVVHRGETTPGSLMLDGKFMFVSAMFSRTEWTTAETTRQLVAWIEAGHPVEWEPILTREAQTLRAVMDAVSTAPHGDGLAPVIPLRLKRPKS